MDPPHYHSIAGNSSAILIIGIRGDSSVNDLLNLSQWCWPYSFLLPCFRCYTSPAPACGWERGRTAGF